MDSQEPLRRAAGLVLFVGSDPGHPGELSWPALAALEAADVVLHDPAVAPETLALVPRRCLVEPAMDYDGTERARQLASDGWRVVRLVAGAPEATDAANLGIAGIRTGIFAGAAGDDTVASRSPRPLATPLNGLAG